MWKLPKDENKPVPPRAASRRPGAAPPVGSPSQEPVQRILTPQSVDGFHPDVTPIEKSIVIKVKFQEARISIGTANWKAVSS